MATGFEQLSYGQVRDLYEGVLQRNPDLEQLSLPEFAASLNRSSGSQMYSQGLSDNVFKRYSYGLDKALRPLGKHTEEASAALAQGLGLGEYEDIARHMGKELPRGLLETALVFLPGGQLPRLAAYGGAAAGALSAGTKGYTESGSPAVGAVQGGLTALLPQFVQKGGQLATTPLRNMLYKEVTGRPGQTTAALVPKTAGGYGTALLENVTEEVGRNVGAAINQELAIQGSSLVTGQGLAGYDEEHIAQLVAGTAPFALLDIARVLPRGLTKDATGQRVGPRSSMEARALVQTARAQGEVARFRQTRDEQVEDIVRSGVASLDAVKEAKQVNFLKGHLRKTVTRAQAAGKALTFDDLITFEPFAPGEAPRKAGVSEVEKLQPMVDEFVRRGILTQDASGTFKVTGQIDLSTAFKNDMQTMMPLKAESSEFPGFLDTGKYLYYRGRSPETGVINFPPRPASTYIDPKLPYSWIGPSLVQVFGETPKMRANPDAPRTTVDYVYDLLPAWPEEPKTAGEVRPTLELIWKRLAQIWGEDQSKAPERRVKVKQGEKELNIEGTQVKVPVDVTQSEYVLSRKMPKEAVDFYTSIEKMLLDRFGAAKLEDLDALPPETMPFKTPEIDPRVDLAAFVAQVKATFPDMSRQQSTLTQVEPTIGERYEFATELVDHVRQLIVMAATAKPSSRLLALTDALKDSPKAKVKAELERVKGMGPHKWLQDLLHELDVRHMEKVREVSEMLDVLSPKEVANRMYNLQMKRLQELMEVQKVVEAPLEAAIVDGVRTTKQVERALFATKKEIPVAEEQLTFERLRQLDSGAVPWGKAVVNALAKLTGELTVRGEQIKWLKNTRPGKTQQAGSTDLLSDYGYYLLFKRAADLIDPVQWQTAKDRVMRKSDYTVTDEDVAWQHLRNREKMTKEEWDNSNKYALINDLVREELAEKYGHTEGIVGPDPALQFIDDPNVMQRVADAADAVLHTARTFPKGSQADQALQSVVDKLINTPAELRTPDWWKTASKATLRFHPDGRIDWEASKRIPVERERVLPDMVEKWNATFDIIANGDYGLVTYLTPSGELGVRIADRPNGGALELGTRKLDILEDVGAIPAAKLKELRDTMPTEARITEQVKKSDPTLTESGKLVARVAYEQAIATRKWALRVDESFTNWQYGPLKTVTQRIQGLVLKEFEGQRPPPIGIESKQALGVADKLTGQDAQTAAILERAITESTTKPEDRLRVMAGAKAFFEQHWRDLGLMPEQAKLYTDIAMNVAAAFHDIGTGRIARTVEDVQGQYIGLGFRKYIIGLGQGSEMAGITARALYKDPRLLATSIISTLGHELTHAMTDPVRRAELKQTNPELYANIEAVNRWAVELSPEERGTIIYRWTEIVEPVATKAVQNFAELRFNKAYEDPREFLADLGSMMVLGVARPDVEVAAAVRRIGTEALFDQRHVQNMLKGLFVPIIEVSRALGQYFETQVPKAAVERMNNIVDSMASMLKTTSEQINNVRAAFDSLEMFDRANYERLMSEGYTADAYGLEHIDQMWDTLLATPGVPKMIVENRSALFSQAKREIGLARHELLEKHYGLQPNWFEKTFMLPAFLLRRFPALKPVMDVVFRYHGMINDNAVKIALPFMTSTKFLKRKVLDLEGTGLRYLFTHPDANDAASAVGLIMQEQRRLLTRDEITQVATNHGVRDPNAVQHIVDFYDAVKETSPRIRGTIIDGLKTRIARQTAVMTMDTVEGLGIEQAKQLGSILAEGEWTILTSQSPNDVNMAQVQRSALLQQYPKLEKALRFMQPLLAEVKTFAERTADQPWFMTEMRLGKNMVAWWDKGAKKFGSAAFDSIEQLDAFVTKLREREARGEVSSIRPWNKDDRQQSFSGLHPDFIKTLKEMEGPAMVRAIVEAGLSEAQGKKLMEVYEPLEISLRQTEESTTKRFLHERKLAPGRETLNMARGYMQHIESVSRALAKSVVYGDIALAEREPSLRQNPAMLNLAKEHFNNVVRPSGKEWAFTKRLIFSYFMGFNLSSMLIEGTQPFLMLAPTLTRDTGSLATSYAYMGKAAGALWTRIKRKGTFGEVDLDWAFSRALNEQLIDFGATQEFREVEGLATTNLRSLVQGGEGAYNPVTWSKTLLDTYARVGRHLYSFAPRLNSMISFVSLFKAATEHGVLVNGKRTKLGREQAYEYAKGATRAATLGGGVANRPIGLFANMGKAQGMVGLMYSLGTYTFGMISHLASLGLDSIGKSKISEADKAAARKALGQTLLTQVGLAGAMGIPLSGAVMAVLEQLFPTLEVKKTIEDTIAKMMGEDEEGGGVWTDLVMRGAPFALGGVDLSSRLEISQLMGLSPYDGFRLTNVLGPAGSILENMFKAATDASQGKFGDAGETILPTAWKNVVKLWRDDWQVKDAAGRTLLEPTESELAWDLLGFRPKRLIEVRNARRLAQRGDEVWKIKNSNFHDEQAKRMIAGDVAGVRQALLQREAEVEGYSAVAGARSIVDEVMQRTIPFDFAREGIRTNAAERQRLAASAGVQRTPETQRIQMKAQLGAALGIPGAGALSRTEMRLAQIMDYLMGSNPLLSRQEAYEQALLLVGRRAPVLAGQPTL